MTNLLIKWFVKDYKNVSNFKVRRAYGKFASIVGMISNILLFLIKITVGLIFGSISIIADAVNNLTDSASSIIILIGFKLSAKPADKNHPYGHARAEYISGLFVSFIILQLGIQLIKSSINKIINPEVISFNIISVLVLVISIGIKIWQCLFFRKVAGIIHSTAVEAAAVDSRNDIVATAAVLVSIIVASLTAFDLDGYMGIAIAIFIMITGIQSVMDAISPLLGLAPNEEMVDGIYKKILSYDGIIGLHDLTVHNYGPNQYFASVHCEVPMEQDIMVSHDIIDKIERDFLKEENINLVIHIDPVVTDDPKTNELKKTVENLLKEISPKISMHDFRVVWGISHSDIIFDIVVPFDFKISDKEIVKKVSAKITQMNPNYRPIIIVDHHYVPDL